MEYNNQAVSFKFDILRGVAQFGRALGSGPRGRVFKSHHSDHKKKPCKQAKNGLDTGFFHVLKSILQKGIYWNLFRIFGV